MTFQRLETLNDLDTIFERANTSASDVGTWRSDEGGSTLTTATGPGTNSVGSFVYSESSVVASNTGEDETDILANSVLTVRPEVMSAWTGTGRQMLLRTSIAGNSWVETGEGLEVQGRARSEDAWSTIDLIKGWAYSNDYSAGDTITDAAGESLLCAQDGGWIDFSVAIPDHHTEVRIRSKPILTGSQVLHRHDAALWSIDLQDGTRTPITGLQLRYIPDIVVAQGADLNQELPVATGGNGAIVYDATGRAPWMNFDPASRILSGTVPNEFSITSIAYTATDEDNDSATQTFRVRIQMGLHDFPVPTDRETWLRMLVQVGTNEIYREAMTGSLLDTTNPLHDDILVPGLRVNRIRFGADNRLTLNRAGIAPFSSQFVGANPSLVDGMWHVFAESGLATYSVQNPDELDGVGSGFYRTTVGSSADTSVMDSISDGDRIILAFTMPIPTKSAPSIFFTSQSRILEGSEVFTVSGTVTDDLDDDGSIVVAASTDIGTVSTPVNTDGNWSLDITAPPVADSAQTLSVTVTATDSGGLSNSASRDWMVRANQNPTVMITTPGGQQTPGSTIDLRAVASGPEQDQAVTVLWGIVSGGGSLSNPASLDSASIAFPGYTTTEQTVQVRITGTDSLGATAADTVDFTLPAASPPDIPDTLRLTSLGPTSIRATFDDPPTHLPIMQRDIRFREAETENWSERESVTLPHTISDLTPGTSYDVEGRAHSAAGASAWGGFAMATPSALPIALQVEAVSETSLVATWMGSTEATETITSYDIRISVEGQDTWQESHDVVSPYTFDDLEKGMNYEVQIRSVDSNGAGPWSQSNHATTHLVLNATMLKHNEQIVYRTDWKGGVIYKVHNNGKVALFFNHTTSSGVRLTFLPREPGVKGAGGKQLAIVGDEVESEIVEHKVLADLKPDVYNDNESMMRFVVSKIIDDGMPITGLEIAVVRHP